MDFKFKVGVAHFALVAVVGLGLLVAASVAIRAATRDSGYYLRIAEYQESMCQRTKIQAYCDSAKKYFEKAGVKPSSEASPSGKVGDPGGGQNQGKLVLKTPHVSLIADSLDLRFIFENKKFTQNLTLTKLKSSSPASDSVVLDVGFAENGSLVEMQIKFRITSGSRWRLDELKTTGGNSDGQVNYRTSPGFSTIAGRLNTQAVFADIKMDGRVGRSRIRRARINFKNLKLTVSTEGGLAGSEVKIQPKESTPTPVSVVPNPVGASDLRQIITSKNREGFRAWAASRSIAEINNAVFSLSSADKDLLIDTVLKIDGSSSDVEKADARDGLIGAIRSMFSKKELGFYSEILSYTTINIQGNGYFGGCNNLWIGVGGFSNNNPLAENRARLMHEAWHSFNCVNGGSGGALDEGAGVWIFKRAFSREYNNLEIQAGWAETTYGTVNYYRDISVVGLNSIPLNAGTSGTQKYKDAMSYLASGDPSKLPWNDQTKLTRCYDFYFKNLNRNIDFNEWLVQAANASQQMAINGCN